MRKRLLLKVKKGGNRRRFGRGFTFIELMVVIMMIAGLTLFAVPKWQRARIMENSALSGTNLKTMNMALTQYTMERGAPPDANGEPWKETNLGDGPKRWGTPKELNVRDSMNFFEKVIDPYAEGGLLYVSPNVGKGGEVSYQYALVVTREGRGKGVIISMLNGNGFGSVGDRANGGKYEPDAKDGTPSLDVEGVQTVAPWLANGYEDPGFIFASMYEQPQ